MNTAPLKTYAPLARKAFIAAVGRRAELLGLNPAHPATVQQQGDVLLINGQPHPARIAEQRRKLAARIQQQSYASVIEALAYTWFNRLVAIRYMELHGYLDHGYRVLSHPDGGNQPEILEHLARIELPGLDRQQALEWKAAGNRDEDLYRAVLLAQCHALHTAMPFLFEAIDDATELLLPDGLLRTDSLIRELVTAIEEASWQDVEIIGWLYQFYISEKKDQVIGKVVKSEDIPAATQLFTPNWIVKYMVQNSLGAQWLATYPDSGLKAQMAYYIEPAEQTDEVKAQLAAITPASFDPEALTLIDPACGSGHILVEAYELFKAIYLERGYPLRDVAKLILEKNLYGLDIDERAAQLTGFALMMKARADDRRLFERGVQLNVTALQDSTGFDAERLAQSVKLADYGLKPGDLTALKALFEHATTFGSLIQVPEGLSANLPALRRLSETAGQDLFVKEALAQLAMLVRQAEMLKARYDAVVANPPYLSSGGMNAVLKGCAQTKFPEAKSDLFACFIERSYTMSKASGHNAMVTMQSWMFLSSFRALRERMLKDKTITTMAQIGYNSFPSLNSKVAQATVFSLANHRRESFISTFVDLNSAPQSACKEKIFLKRDPANWFAVSTSEFERIPGSPVAYWVHPKIRSIFDNATLVGTVAEVRQGLATGENNRFLRAWQEPSFRRIGLGHTSIAGAVSGGQKWFPYNKGGDFRKWYGNHVFVVNWEDDGREIRAFGTESGGRPRSRAQSTQFYFRPSLSWSKVTSSGFALRSFPAGFIFDVAGCSIFARNLTPILGCMNSAIMTQAVNSLSPTLNYEVGQVQDFPFVEPKTELLAKVIEALIESARSDWNSYERS